MQNHKKAAIFKKVKKKYFFFHQIMLTHARLDKRMNTKIVSIFIFPLDVVLTEAPSKVSFIPSFQVHTQTESGQKNIRYMYCQYYVKGLFLIFVPRAQSFTSLKAAFRHWKMICIQQVPIDGTVPCKLICICLVLIWANIPMS